jgi:hypothetical protein
MPFVLKRTAVALTMASLWIGWAVWANVPHYFDARAMEKEIATVIGPANVNLQPAQAGFPFAYMHYDYSNGDQLTIYDATFSTLLPNVLFALVGTLGVVLLAMRIRRLSISGLLMACSLIAPAVVMYIRLNGWHPDVVAYVYILPLIVLLMSIVVEKIRERRRQNKAMHPSREVEVFENGQSSVATG